MPKPENDLVEIIPEGDSETLEEEKEELEGAAEVLEEIAPTDPLLLEIRERLERIENALSHREDSEGSEEETAEAPGELDGTLTPDPLAKAIIAERKRGLRFRRGGSRK